MTAGTAKQLQAIQLNLQDRNRFDGDTAFDVHITGAAGELAVAKVLDIFYDADVNGFKSSELSRVIAWSVTSLEATKKKMYGSTCLPIGLLHTSCRRISCTTLPN